jgi:putative peptidoglycan lipid II flippase
VSGGARAGEQAQNLGEEARVARSAGKVGLATLLSRVLGLVREQVMASLFGAGLATDAFNVAFRIPNLLRDLFAEGAMSSAFVPTFTGIYQRNGAAEAWEFGRRLLVTLFLCCSACAAVGYVAWPRRWCGLFAPGFGAIPASSSLTVMLTRVMLPFLPRWRWPRPRWAC